MWKYQSAMPLEHNLDDLDNATDFQGAKCIIEHRILLLKEFIGSENSLEMMQNWIQQKMSSDIIHCFVCFLLKVFSIIKHVWHALEGDSTYYQPLKKISTSAYCPSWHSLLQCIFIIIHAVFYTFQQQHAPLNQVHLWIKYTIKTGNSVLTTLY